jgi:hypothetical protein
MDSHPVGWTYVACLPSGQLLARYDAWGGTDGVSFESVRNAVSGSSTVEVVDASETPFAELAKEAFPSRVIRLDVFGHCDAFVLCLPGSCLVVDWDDDNFSHSSDDLEYVRTAVDGAQEVEVVSISGTPFEV